MRESRRKFRWQCAALSACATFAVLCVGAAASADTLTFIRENNVWISNADGSGQYEVTLDGTAGAPYSSPSESDGGTILAIRRPPGQRNQLFRMTQSGALLNPPVNTPAPGPAGALDAKISPDGTLAAYWFVTEVSGEVLCPFCIEVTSRTLISHADRFTAPEEVGTPHTGVQPSWISNSTLLLSNFNGTQWYYSLGMKEAAQWFQNEGALKPEFETISDSEVAPTGDRMAVVYGDSENTLWLIELKGPPPTEPVAVKECFLGPKGKFVDPTWRSDGSELYWQEDDGVWAAAISGPLGCSGAPSLLIPSAREPDASPAALAPGPRPGCGNPGDPVACPPEVTAKCSCGVAVSLDTVLEGLLKTESRALTKLKLRGLRSKGRMSVRLTSPFAGTLTVTLGARSGRRTTILAKGRHTFAAPGSASVTLALTSQGRKRLHHAHTLHAVLTLSFTAAGSSTATSEHATVALR